MSNIVRTLPAYLSPIVEMLELNQPDLVTIRDIEKYAIETKTTLAAARVAFDLKKRGWLLPTSVRGVYEFSPGANAGAYSRGGKLTQIKAISLANPKVEWYFSFTTALYFHGIIDQMPDNPELFVVGKNVRNIAYPFLNFTHKTFKPNIKQTRLRNLPVEKLETLLVHICERPKDVKNWYPYLENLPQIWKQCNKQLVKEELKTRTQTTRHRFAYIFSAVDYTFSNQIMNNAKIHRPTNFTLPINPREIVQKGGQNA